MTIDQLKDKAHSLPLAPGVYIMRDAGDKVIYVGKAKKLKNRVSQYFLDTVSHSPKTRLMVSKIDHFDVIVAASEFEALVLECSLIKRHMPKYNILLKDDKGYPYIRLDMKKEYPRPELVSKLADDGASYYGPYGSRGTTNSAIEAILHTLKLPDCSRVFPRDIGKQRPCLNYHMNRCSGWCRVEAKHEEYRAAIEQARQLLQGNYRSVAEDIRKQMLQAAEELNFELAASLRDRLNAVEALGQKQFVIAGASADTDVIGYGQSETRACFAVLHFLGGDLIDKDYEVFSLPDDREEALSGLVKQYYLSRGVVPKRVLMPFAMDDAELFSQLLEQKFGRKTRIHVPQRGDNMRLVELACTNAGEEARRVTGREERLSGSLSLLGKMLSMDPPERIESYDISNISGTDIVAGMVVFQDGKPKKSEYKRFQLQDMAGQDDYGAMRQVLLRRFRHYLDGDKSFCEKPSVLFIDGGVTHARTAREALQSLGLDFPIFGMVKDDRHRTRAMVTPEGKEIAIDSNQAVFAFVGTIQEEVHRYAISYHRKLRSKRLRYSQPDEIPGIGPKRKQLLLKTYGSLTAIGQATVYELERVLPADAAMAVWQHFHHKEDEPCE